ncbi:MAG: DUF6506 family protein [Candidatus Zixiibacteriota bacterium]
MAFKAVFIAHVPDADPQRHMCVLETDMYKLFSVLVKNQSQAIEVSKRLVKEEGVHSIILCPGNTHKDVAEISEAVGKDVSVSVARGDNPSMQAARRIMEREGWFSGRA